MPEMKRNFTKGKMNKDLDERLVPSGEYRDAMNIQVSTSEGSDVGTIQNVLGNTPGCVYLDPLVPNPIPTGSTTVGSVSDEKNDSLYWLVAGPSDIGSELLLGDTDTLKDMIMRTNASVVSGCEPVFVDKYGWCIGVDPAGGTLQNSIAIDPTLMYNVTAGMNVTGYNGGVVAFGPTLVTSVGSLSTLAPISYFQNYTSQSVIQQDVLQDVSLRVFDNYACNGGNQVQFQFTNYTPCINYGGAQQNLPPNGSSQIFFPGTPPQGVVVGATLSNSPYYANGGTITNIYTGMICTGPNSMSGCTPNTILTIDTLPTASPPFNQQNQGGFPTDNEAPFAFFSIVITPPPVITYIPNNIINILPGGSQWLDEVYNILWDGQGNWTGAELVIDSNFGGGVNFPPYTCIDPNSVTGINDSQYELVGCSWGPNPGQSVNALNLNPHNYPISFSTLFADGIEAIFLNVSVDLNFSDTLCFTSERVLEFDPNNLITGINIIDDILLWTDNFTEPKKINIPRSIAGTDSLGDTHTAVINNATGLTLANYNPIRKEHITVIRKSPKGALNLELLTGRDPDLNYSGITYTAIDPAQNANTNASSIISSSNNTVVWDFSTLQVGDRVAFEIETNWNGFEDFNLEWNTGDVVLLKEFDELGIKPPIPLADWTIRGIITNWQWNSFVNDTNALNYQAGFVGSQWNGGQFPSSAPGTAHVEIEILNLKGTPPQVDPNNNLNPISLNYVVDLESEKDLIFEDNFPRFSYRYKYEDGEYSTFAPWSEVAFSPSHFNYEPKRGWNTGMINHTTSVKFKGFIPTVLGQPLGQDVIEIDILYKEEDSPNIYVVETISPLDISPIGITNAWWANEYEIKSETIRHVLPSNQLLRSWDNVPKKALAQDVSGNRVVYANYEQSFDLMISGQKFKPEFENRLSSWAPSQPGTVQKSIKSLRDYKLGVVFTDEYGRETPILISKSGGFKVDKRQSDSANRLVAGLRGSAPSNIDYFKFFIKETSTEYYNLAMDRWYNAEDGNIWLSFPSTDRDKVDLETSLYFKKGVDDEAIENTTKYKILAIENQAPEFIKTRRIRIGTATHNAANTGGVPVAPLPIYLFGGQAGGINALDDAPLVTLSSFTLHWSVNSNDFNASSLSHLEDVNEDLYIQFINSSDSSGQYKISEITSDREVQTSQSINDGIGGTANVSKYHITLAKPLENDIDFIFDNPAAPSFIENFVKVQFTKAVVEHKPKYEGRFFAKIENDGKIKPQITDYSRASYIIKASKMVYALYDDEHLAYKSMHACFSNNIDNVLPSVSGNMVTKDWSMWVNPSDNGYLNPNGRNWNYHFARSNYFGPGIIDNIGPKYLANHWTNMSTGASGIISQPNHPKYAALPGVWFIDKSTKKHTSWANNGAEVGMAWSDSFNGPTPPMPNFSPSSDQGAPGWTYNFQLGGGLSNFGTTTSVINLAFGGIENFGQTGIQGNISGTDNWGSYPEYGGVFPDFFSVGEDGVGNYGDTTTVDFVDRLSGPGNSFMWQHDPTETSYMLVNQLNISNHVRFGKNDDMYSTARGIQLTGNHSSYHKVFRTNVEPSMANWDPVNGGFGGFTGVGTHPVSHLYLKDMVVQYEHVYGTSGNNTSIPDDNYIVVDSVMSTCSNGNTTKVRYRLHEGMMLTDYNLGSTPVTPASNGIPGVSNIIIKSIGEYSANAGGGFAGYKITLTGYHEPLHFTSAFPELGGVAIANEAIGFRQVTMNGISNNTEANTDYYQALWKNDIGVVGGCGGIGAVGYRMDMVEVVDAYEDGGNLPPNPYVWETEPKDDTGLDIYYEISENNPITLNTNTIPLAIPTGSVVENPSGFGHSWNGVTVSNNISATGDIIDLFVPFVPPIFGIWIGAQPFALGNNSWIQPLTIGDILKITRPSGISFEVEIINIFPDPNNPDLAFSFQLKSSLYNSDYHLNWHNCYSFGNGVESNRIKDNFNLPYIANGIKASTTLDREYKQERRKHGLIYSGLYNSTSGVNNLNQFIAAEKITKDINPIYGSIQKLKAGWGVGGDLVALCEDRVLRILADKDALYNADGNTNVTATNRVLGTATPYTGEYGISTNPESFASESYRAYFTDKVRGAVMRLSNDGLTPISDHGMKDWFRDNLKLNNKLVGSFDDKKNEYNITLKQVVEAASFPEGKTVTFREDVKGWVSFKSFVTNNGISCANEYYTFNDGDLWRHHHDVLGNRNTFYNIPKSSTFNVLLNDAPGIVKSFHTLNYEGSQTKVTPFISTTVDDYGNTIPPTTDNEYYNLTAKPGWYVDSVFTNKESGRIEEFIEKEGKWFYYLKGEDIPHDSYDNIMIDASGDSLWDQASFAIQGIGALVGVNTLPILGCMDINAINFDPTANTSCDGTVLPCVDDAFGVMQTIASNPLGCCCEYPPALWGCMQPSSPVYSSQGFVATNEDGSCTWSGCVCDPGLYPDGCTNPTLFSQDALTYNGSYAGALIDDGSCIAIVEGCTDPTAFNYNPLANTEYPVSNCVPVVEGCLGQGGGLATQASNYDATANTDNGSCIWSYCDDPLDINGDDANYNALAITESTGYIFDTGNFPSAGVTTTDCISGGCMDASPGLWFDVNGVDSNGVPCVYPCADGFNANNYDPAATWDDGSCAYEVIGCTDSLANNYDPTATTDDGSCLYDPTYSCELLPNGLFTCTDPGDGSGYWTGASAYIDCWNDFSSAMPVCPGVIWGCNDPAASNYNPSVNAPCGNCCLACVYGCNDANAPNYDATATCDDGSCIGCDGFTSSFIVTQPSGPGATDGSIVITITSQYPFTGNPGQFLLGDNPPVGIPVPTFVWSNNNQTVTITLSNVGELGAFTLSIFDQTNFPPAGPGACTMFSEDIDLPDQGIPGCMTMGATNYAGPGSGVIPEANIDDGSCAWVISGDSPTVPGTDVCQILNYQPACAPGCVFLNMGGTLDQALCDCCNDANTQPNIEVQGNIYYGCWNYPNGC